MGDGAKAKNRIRLINHNEVAAPSHSREEQCKYSSMQEKNVGVWGTGEVLEGGTCDQ